MERIPRDDWSQILRPHRASYDGTVQSIALPLRWPEIELGLPKPGTATSVDVLDVVEPYMRELGRCESE